MLEKVSTWVELAMRAEVHAFVLIFTGAGLVMTGHKDEGMLVMGGGLGIFKGKA